MECNAKASNRFNDQPFHILWLRISNIGVKLFVTFLRWQLKPYIHGKLGAIFKNVTKMFQI